MKNQLNFKDIAINSKSKSGKEIGKIMASMELDVAYLISRHEKAIKILEGIQTFKSLKKLKQDSLNGIGGTYPEMKKRYLHEIDIYNRCIDRLILRYKKIK